MMHSVQPYPLTSNTTRIDFIDARLPEQEIKTQHRRATTTHLIAAIGIIAAFAAVVSVLGPSISQVV